MREPWRARLKSAAQNLGLLALSTLVAAGGAEWILRKYRPERGLVYRLAPRYHHTLVPGARKLFRHGAANGGGLVLTTVNSDGYRGDELRSDGVPRVVVYGDSFIEAEFATLPETFAKRLEARLGAGLGRSVEVVNAGVNGYGPDQALRRFEDEAPKLRPALVVFSIFADNDFGDLLRNRLYRLDENGRLIEGRGIVGIFLRRDFEEAAERTPFHLRRGLERLLRGRRRAAEVREQQLPEKLARYIPKSIELCRQEYEAVVVRRQSEVTSVIEDHYDADVSLSPGSPAAVYKLRLFEAVLGRMHVVTLAAGVPALVLVIPSPIDVCPSYDVRVDPLAFPEYRPSRLSAQATGAAKRQGLPVVDLFGPFREAGADGMYYRHGNDHWNAAGQDLAARLVAERVLAERWLGPAR